MVLWPTLPPECFLPICAKDHWLCPICPILECFGICQGFPWLPCPGNSPGYPFVGPRVAGTYLSWCILGLMGWSSCFPLLRLSSVPWALQRRPSLSGQVPDGLPHWGLPATPATRLACPHIDHATQYSCSGLQGEVWAIDLAKSPPLFCSLQGHVVSQEVFETWVKRGQGPKVSFHWLAPVGCILSLGQGGNLPHWGVPPVLCSLKMTCLLSLAGLGEGANLFGESPVWPATEGTCTFSPACRHLLQLLKYPLLCECWWLPNCPWLLDHPQETEQPSPCMWPSNWAAAASNWQWASQATLRASCDSCHLFLKWSGVTCVPCWNSDQGSDLEVLADPPLVPLAGQDPTYAGGVPLMSWGSPGGSLPPSLGHRVPFWGPSSAGTPHCTMF